MDHVCAGGSDQKRLREKSSDSSGRNRIWATGDLSVAAAKEQMDVTRSRLISKHDRLNEIVAEAGKGESSGESPKTRGSRGKSGAGEIRKYRHRGILPAGKIDEPMSLKRLRN